VFHRGSTFFDYVDDDTVDQHGPGFKAHGWQARPDHPTILRPVQHKPVAATAGPAAATRRTQAERRATTRAALADAAIDVLIERGWAAVTAIEVCNRAGVTRGALHHCYDGLPALLADALRRLYAVMTQPGRPAPADLPGLIDATWAVIGNPSFKEKKEASSPLSLDSVVQTTINDAAEAWAAPFLRSR
jgi:AcrR family transcriptional regulator